MCTVTYIPLGKNDFILTSNRDESPLRETIPPKNYVEEGVKLTYPKDEVAGGTWIGLSDKKRLVCLLNGGFKIHKRADSYRMSRGVIVKKILKTDNAVREIEDFDFNNIEPFTIVLVDWQKELKAYELVWTGEEKFFKVLEQQPKMWSSSTLYDDSMKKLRNIWFEEWIKNSEELTQDKILRFHQRENEEYPSFSLKMKRETVQTVSVSSIKKNKNKINISYINVLDNNAMSVLTTS